jgi:transglutaminase-like putative cysteine protease
MWMLTAAAFAAGATDSAQTAFDAERRGATTTLSYRWKAADGSKDAVSFEVPSASVQEDQLDERYLPRRDLYDAAKDAVNALKVPHVNLTAAIDHGELTISAKGTGDVKRAMDLATQTRDHAIGQWLVANDYTYLHDGSITFDHARLVAAYADDLRPVADALAAGTTSDRAFVERALTFVQSLPYESRKRKGADPGYRRPLSVLAADKGDCDSKSVLFLGIVAAHLPSVPLAVVYVPGHALAGVGLEKEPGDKTFKEDGVRFLYAEPVGPALLPLGGKVPSAHKVGHGEVRVVPSSEG